MQCSYVFVKGAVKGTKCSIRVDEPERFCRKHKKIVCDRQTRYDVLMYSLSPAELEAEFDITPEEIEAERNFMLEEIEAIEAMDDRIAKCL